MFYKVERVQGIDENLWQQIQHALQHGGLVDGCRVIPVNGDDVKLMEDRPTDDPHMDFVEGGNDLEAAWVKREFGSKVLLVDRRINPQDWQFILLHEACERRLMAKGMSYPAAHKRANAMERLARLRAKGSR